MENKKKSTLIKDAIALFVITLVSGLALSYVYEITKAPIEQQQEDKKLKANQAVNEEAVSFTEDEELMKLAESADLVALNPDFKGVTIDEINKALDGNNEMVGYNIMVTTTTGYKDPITLVIGYSKDGQIKGIEIISINETAGLGMNADKPQFLNKFLNKEVDQFTVVKTGSTSEDQIDAISGATITTRAVTNAINTGIGFLKEYATDLGGGQNE